HVDLAIHSVERIFAARERIPKERQALWHNEEISADHRQIMLHWMDRAKRAADSALGLVWEDVCQVLLRHYGAASALAVSGRIRDLNGYRPDAFGGSGRLEADEQRQRILQIVVEYELGQGDVDEGMRYASGLDRSRRD